MKLLIKHLHTKFLSRSYFIKEWKGEDVISSNPYRVVFFSHFDPQGRVHDYVVHYLKELQVNNGLIIFISTSPFLDENSISKIKPYCFRILLRKNIGLDFGSWRMAFDRHAELLKHANGLLLVNDSCFGPLFSLEKILADFEGKNSLSGITLNYEITPHLQSYFLYIPAKLFGSVFLTEFIKRVQYLENKDKIIYDYEIGISTFALNKGVTLNAWVDNTLLEKNNPGIDAKKNLTIWYCDLLLKQKLSPFIKKAIFTNSAHLIRDQQKAVKETLQLNYPEYSAMIKEYL